MVYLSKLEKFSFSKKRDILLECIVNKTKWIVNEWTVNLLFFVVSQCQKRPHKRQCELNKAIFNFVLDTTDCTLQTKLFHFKDLRIIAIKTSET